MTSLKNQVKAHGYVAMYSSEDVSVLFEHAIDLIDVDIEAVLQKFNEGVRRLGHCM